MKEELERLFQQFDELFERYRAMRANIREEMTSVVNKILTTMRDPRANALNVESIEGLKDVVEEIRRNEQQKANEEMQALYREQQISHNKYNETNQYPPHGLNK